MLVKVKPLLRAAEPKRRRGGAQCFRVTTAAGVGRSLAEGGESDFRGTSRKSEYSCGALGTRTPLMSDINFMDRTKRAFFVIIVG